MSADKTIEIAGREIRIRELTTQEIRDWMRRVERGDAPEGDPIGHLLFDDFTLFDLQAMTDMAMEDLLPFTPSELEEINQSCREVNRAFFLLRDRMTAIGEEVLQAQASNTPAPPWYAPVMPTSGSTRWRSFWRHATRPLRAASKRVLDHRRWRDGLSRG